VTINQSGSQAELDQHVINALKGLVIDGVNRAKSGHPGGAMSSMDFAYLLWSETLRLDPADPKWLGRDRFILSAGHESMLLYALLHMTGWLALDELKNFRQLHSKTPGHPENILTPGVECTTGPLGQGAAMSVGFAIAAEHFAARLDAELFGHRTWVLLGDGCMQEDVTLGAASLAGHLGLKSLVWYYDKNRQQISGAIDRATSDNEAMIFRGFGWDVIEVDGHDHAALRGAIAKARTQEKPLLIIGTSVMAKGAATLENSHKTHGEPLPADERVKTKAKLGIPDGAEFFTDDRALKHFRRKFASNAATAQSWRDRLQKLQKSDDTFARTFHQCFTAEPIADLPGVPWPKDKPLATRNAFGDLLQAWAEKLPGLMGGSADLEPSNMTGAFAKIVGDFQAKTKKGRNLAFGVREFPMSAIANGMALHGGLVPFDATFLSFADYSRPALRLGAIQRVRVIHEFTHDSIFLGEDGPTHQPVEHLMSLRMIPDFYLMRPADAQETDVLFRKALALSAPSAICLSRQKLPMLQLDSRKLSEAARGGYVVRDTSGGAPKMIIMATGSEVDLALRTAAHLDPAACEIRVVSMPCWELFLADTAEWRESVLPRACTRRVSIEAGATLGWERFVGSHGLTIGIDTFGASAPMEALAEEFGLTVAKVAARIATHSF